jgi:hypothetical protein
MRLLDLLNDLLVNKPYRNRRHSAAGHHGIAGAGIATRDVHDYTFDLPIRYRARGTGSVRHILRDPQLQETDDRRSLVATARTKIGVPGFVEDRHSNNRVTAAYTRDALQ